MGFPFPIFVSNLGNMSVMLLAHCGRVVGMWPLRRKALAIDSLIKIVLPLAFFSTFSLVAGNSAYLYISVPLIQIMKSSTLVLVMLFGFALGAERFTWQLAAAVCTIVVGVGISVGFDAGTGAGRGPTASGSSLGNFVK